jgi:acyl-coenzyme A synthetase/AMP-(fatty) acid ligase
MLSGLAHDPLLRDVFTPLTLGAAVVVPAAGDVDGPGSLAAWAARERITVMHLTPAMAHVLTEGVPAGALPALEHVFLGGDRLTGDTVARLREVAPRAECVGFYGATETPQAMGWFRVPDAPDWTGAGRPPATPLGRGIGDVQLLVLGRGGLLAGVGELGEVTVRTPHLARGYLNDPGLTEQRFIACPFRRGSRDRLYRTGDLGRFAPDGTVDFYGRGDGQVKVRGYRVETGEVASALSRLPEVSNAAVAVQAGGAGDPRLVGYVVLRPGSSLTAAALRSQLAGTLPDYMVPASLVFLPSLPLTANGKLDLRALPAPGPAGDAASYEAPRTPAEQALARIWAELLDVELRDDFFALGGHSLLAMRVAARIKRELRVDLPLRAFFESPTVEGMARALEGEAGTEAASAPPAAAIPRVSRASRRIQNLETRDP